MVELEVISENSDYADYASENWLIKESYRELLKLVGKNIMTSDTIADFLTRIKNAYLAHQSEVTIPSSKMKQQLAQLLEKECWVGRVTIINAGGNRKIKINLLYQGNQPKITQIERVSKPGRKVYVGKTKIPKILGGLGVAILSTSSGLMTDKEARQRKIGGEVICKIW